ncbi:unnamed protein product [Orchesella dallaii]|uniref:Uncharacterized protein n=1 Tax=Orchesella dallaii TaxID=48710 RepID=A0ABP1QDH0_9HEXA
MGVKRSTKRWFQLLNMILCVSLVHTQPSAEKCTSSRPGHPVAEPKIPSSSPPAYDWTKWIKPQDCAGDSLTIKTSPSQAKNPMYRTNSVQDFCIIMDVHDDAAAPSPQGPPLPPRSTLPNYDSFPEPKPCYEPDSSAGSSLGQNPTHSAGNNPNWAILEHLVRHKAQSLQPYDDLPYVYNYWETVKYQARDTDHFIIWPPGQLDWVSPPLPKPKAPNPYFVETTGISLKGELLHNYLHFRIFANLSVALGKGQAERYQHLHQSADEEYPNHATGKISALLIMVKDQNGWPVGDFSTPIPCARTCREYSHDIYYGDERNAVPCSYTPPQASMHPGMFVFDADPGRYCTNNLYATHKGSASPAPAVPDPRMNPQTARLEGVREVHATWTLIFEDVETVYPGYFKKYNYINPPAGETEVTQPKPQGSFLFGWTAQYNILKTTRGSLGAPDYVNLKYLRERDSRSDDIDCHVPLFDAVNPVKSSFRKFIAPSHEAILDPGNAADAAEIRVPSRLGYNQALWGIYKQSGDINSKVRYFGQHAKTSNQKCREMPKNWMVDDDLKKVFGDKLPPSAKTFFERKSDKGVRCPCPALPSTLPPENRTADPARVKLK